MNFAQKAFPEIMSNSFIFDTELIVYAKRSKIQMKVVPVDWVENRPWGGSKILPFRVMLVLLANLAMLKASQINGQGFLSHRNTVVGRIINYRLNRHMRPLGPR